MELTAECPSCRKQLRYDAKSAGLVSLCPACGARLTLPYAGSAPPPLPPQAETPPPLPLSPPTPPPPTQEPVEPISLEPLLSEKSSAETPPVETPPPPSLPPMKEPTVIVEYAAPTSNLVPWLIALAAVAFIESMLLLYTSLHVKPTWESLHRQEVLDLKTEAESLANQGRTAEAYQRFLDLQRMVTGNSITDPTLIQALHDAQDEEADAARRIWQQAVAESPKPAPPVVVEAPPTQPAATQPVVAEAPPAPSRPPVHALPAPDPGKTASGLAYVDDDRIGRTIEAGVKYLTDSFQQMPDGSMRVKNNSGYSDDGVDALVVYALLQAYQATDDSSLDPRRAFMKSALDTLRRLPMNDRYQTYSHSLRANALQLAGRKEDEPYLENDLHWLLRAGLTGAYTYVQRPPSPTHTFDDTVWDNSNTQYGLLGVWAAAEAGLDVPAFYWKAAQQHWIDTQHDDGRWGYTQDDTDGTRSMTLAGLASLFVTQDYLYEADRDNAVARQPFSPQLQKGLDWLDSGDNSVVSFDDGFHAGYTLYGLERVGLASGFKYFGPHDWYRESAADVVNAAQSDGSWGDPINTSFAMLFLARGRHPVIMNKLSFDGNWDNRPRDVANLAHYSSRTVEHPLNWQVVPNAHDWTDWTDSPILYIASNDRPNLNSDDETKLKSFVQAGGLLVTEGDGANNAMDLWAQDLGRRLFAPHDWAELRADSPVWSVALHVKNRPKILAIGNGARLLMVQLPDDISAAWQSRDEINNSDAFELGLNLFLYASGRSELRNRLVSNAIPDAPGDPSLKVKIAQLQMAPDSDPEPFAWPRFARWFRWQTDYGIDVVPTAAEDLNPGSPKIAHLTGVAAFKAADPQCDALREYVRNGGVVLIDPCGGPNDFLRSVRDDLIPRLFPNVDPVRLDDQSSLLTNSADGMSQLWPPDIRDFVREEPSPIERGIFVWRFGKGAVVLSSLDITSGLLGTNTWGIAGFRPDYSLALAKNFVLWALDGAKN